MNSAVARWAGREAVERLLEFNCFPGLYLHEQWTEQMAHGALVRKLIGLRARSRALSRYIFNYFGIDSVASIEPTEPFYRILLMERASLLSVLTDVGVFLKFEEVRNSIDGNLIRSKLKGVDPESLDRVLARLDGLREALSQMTSPPALASGVLANLGALTAGQVVLASALRGEPPAVAKRVQLKLGPFYARLGAALSSGMSPQHCRALISAFA